MAIFIISHSHMVRDILRTTCKLRDFDVANAYADSSALTALEKDTVVVLHTGRNLEDVEKQVTHLHNLCRDIRIMLISPETAIDSIRVQFATRVHAIMPEDNPTEALIGAVYLDGGLQPASDVIKRVVLLGCESVLARRSLRNYKSRLQELIQSRYKSPPRYKVTKVAGPDHDRVFQVSVTFNGEILGTGEGRNKKTAEQHAARLALAKMEQDPEPSDAADD